MYLLYVISQYHNIIEKKGQTNKKNYTDYTCKLKCFFDFYYMAY